MESSATKQLHFANKPADVLKPGMAIMVVSIHYPGQTQSDILYWKACPRQSLFFRYNGLSDIFDVISATSVNSSLFSCTMCHSCL